MLMHRYSSAKVQKSILLAEYGKSGSSIGQKVEWSSSCPNQIVGTANTHADFCKRFRRRGLVRHKRPVTRNRHTLNFAQAYCDERISCPTGQNCEGYKQVHYSFGYTQRVTRQPQATAIMTTALVNPDAVKLKL